MREFKTRQEIGHWLSRRLNRHPGCTETKGTVQYELREPDAEGCNWPRDLSLNYGRDDSVVVNQYVRPPFEEGRRRFSVSEP